MGHLALANAFVQEHLLQVDSYSYVTHKASNKKTGCEGFTLRARFNILVSADYLRLAQHRGHPLFMPGPYGVSSHERDKYFLLRTRY